MYVFVNANLVFLKDFRTFYMFCISQFIPLVINHKLSCWYSCWLINSDQKDIEKSWTQFLFLREGSSVFSPRCRSPIAVL